jgi:hypothetical protein
MVILYLHAKGTRPQSKGDAIEVTEYSTKQSGERKVGFGQNRVTVYSFPKLSTLPQGLEQINEKGGNVRMSNDILTAKARVR